MGYPYSVRQEPDMRRISIILLLLAVFLVPVGGGGWPLSVALAVDDENCLMCHKYIKMGRITEEGERKYYYVNETTFSRTVHNRVRCRDCHNYIKKLPHDRVDVGVTCNTECHSIKNPATKKNFSHKNIYDVYRKSVHGRDKVAANERDHDKPYCIFCHTNPEYLPTEKEVPAEITDRCFVCHQDREFVNHRYAHTGRRIKNIGRSPREIVELCSICHGNEEMIEKHLRLVKEEGGELGRKFAFAAESYKESFHWKVIKYGFEEAASCLDCHAEKDNYYLAVHDIRSSRDPRSTTHESNRVKTCKRCHTRADESFREIDPHPTDRKDDNPLVYWTELVYGMVGNGVTLALIGLMILETIGRRRDGAAWILTRGSTWRRRSKRGRDRIYLESTEEE